MKQQLWLCLIVLAITSKAMTQQPLKIFAMAEASRLANSENEVQLLRYVVKPVEGGFAILDQYKEPIGIGRFSGFISDTSNQHRLIGKYSQLIRNGMLKQMGVYVNGLRSGKWKSYYDNGTVMDSSFYKDGKIEGFSTRFDSTGKLLNKLQYTEGNLHGENLAYNAEGQVSINAVFENGKLVSCQLVEPAQNSVTCSCLWDADLVALNMADLNRRLKYPEDLRKKKIMGQVYVKVLTNEEGRYIRHEVIRSPHQGLTDEVEKVIHLLHVQPTVRAGHAIKSWVSFPFTFSLQ